MNHAWSLRAEILEVSHRWPLPLLAFLIGSLVGWAVAGLIPTPYRAESSLSVAFSDDLVVRNPDDFKNSQMGELNLFILSRDVLGDTLNRLRNRDSYWNGVSIRDLEGKVTTYWRNTGRWQLVAEDNDPKRAVQLAQSWGNVAAEKVAVALFQANGLMERQMRYQALAREKTEADLRAAELAQVESSLQDWRASAQPDMIDVAERARLEDLIARAVRLDPAGMQIFNARPGLDGPTSDYQRWVDQAMTYVETQQEITRAQQADLASRRNRANLELQDTIKATHGLTALMQVAPLPTDGIAAVPVRWRTDTALIGGLLGLVIWALIWLGLPLLRRR
jgi:hypothetical protein